MTGLFFFHRTTLAPINTTPTGLFMRSPAPFSLALCVFLLASPLSVVGQMSSSTEPKGPAAPSLSPFTTRGHLPMDFGTDTFDLGEMFPAATELAPGIELKALCAYAESGNATAQYQMGMVYLLGRLDQKIDPTAAFPWFEQAAQQGHPEALISTGIMLGNGIGVEIDRPRALEYIRRAAELEVPEAMFQLALGAVSGVAAPKDLPAARRWLEQAAIRGHGASQYLLGRFYELGWTLEKPAWDQARYWYRRALDRGYSEALFAHWVYVATQAGTERNFADARTFYENQALEEQPDGLFHLGWMYLDSIGVERDRVRGLELLRHAAEAGHPQAQYRLGRAILQGFGGQAPAEAREWLGKAANADDVDALVLYGECLLRGVGGEVDPASARTLFEKAAARGNELAMMNLGSMAEAGSALAHPDLATAHKWYEQAGELGHAPALFALAGCFRDGRGVEKDLTKAFDLYVRSANLGFAPAQSNLGVFLRQGQGAEVDFEASVRWLTRAANQGNRPAMFNLAVCHFRGEGTPIDQAEGLKWMRLAAQGGDAEASRLAREVLTFLPETTIAEAARRVSLFQPVSE